MSCWISNIECFVFDDEGHSSYDLIIGRDILKPIGLELNFARDEIIWQHITLPFTNQGKVPQIQEPSIMFEAEDTFSASTIKESDYDTKTTGHEIEEQQVHLSEKLRDRNLTFDNLSSTCSQMSFDCRIF